MSCSFFPPVVADSHRRSRRHLSATNSTQLTRRFRLRKLRSVVSVLLVGICLGRVAAHAWNATWLLNPRSSDWNTATNWTPALVPTGTATFGASHTMAITFSENTSVGALHFTNGAPAYFLDLSGFSLKITGTGVAVESGVIVPTFEDFNTLNFNGGSTAGTAIINNFAGETQFLNTSTAGGAGINNDAGKTLFYSTSTAGPPSLIIPIPAKRIS
jgi:hypothetical protein